MISNAEILEKLDPAIIDHFLTTGESKGIPAETQTWIKQITMAYEEYELNRNITAAAKELRPKIKAAQGINLSQRACVERVYAAIEYFHVDDHLRDKIWQKDFANKYELLSEKAEKGEDYRTAKACLDASLECRQRASEAAAAEDNFAPIFLISPDISILDLGFKKKSLKDIARKHNEGYYISMIDSLPIDNKEKERLLRDAEITREIQDIETD